MQHSWIAGVVLGAAGAMCAACTLVTDLSGLAGDAPSLSGESDATATTDASGATDAKMDASDASNATDAKTDAKADAKADAGSTYAELTLSDAPLVYLRLNEASGAIAADATGHGNTGLLGNGHVFGVQGALAGSADTALRFEGSFSGLDLGRTVDFAGTQPYTLELWAKIRKSDGVYRHLFKKSVGDIATRNAFGVYVQGGNLVFERIVNGTYLDVRTATALLMDRWAHIASVFDGTFIRLYVDGIEAARVADTRAAAAIDASCYIGCGDGFDTNVFDGDVDEVAVYNKALTAPQLLHHWEEGHGN